MPQEWETGMLINVHKKGTKSKCENYGGITLLPTAYKLFAKIIKKITNYNKIIYRNTKFRIKFMVYLNQYT